MRFAFSGLSMLMVLAHLLAACSSSENNSGGEPPSAAPAAVAEAGVVSEGGVPPARSCRAEATKSKCKADAQGAIVRGVARFDPTARAAGSGKPALSLFLRHSFVYRDVEKSIGGRLHAFKRIPLTSEHLASGAVDFTIDLCEFGVAMWSEENGAFNLVAILDENDAHDAEKATAEYPFQTPIKGEMAKMVSGIEISCHADSPCVDVPLDCTDGTACTTIAPITKVECRTPACGSDDAFCTGGMNH